MSKIFTTVAAIAATATAANATTYSTDFENFVLGADLSSSNPIISDPALGANNWRGNGASGLADNGVPGSLYDGEIVDTGTSNGLAYRLSNAKVSGNYDTTHAASPTVTPIGESANGNLPGTFSFSFDFRSAVNSLQDGLVIDVTPFQANSSNRQGIVRITDDPTDGLSVGWWEVDGGFNFVSLDTGLARDEWHSVSVDMNFVEGAANDFVSISVNGGTAATLNTWEGFYPTTTPVDSVIFRVASPADFSANTGGVAALDGGGIFIDNLSITAVPVPTPGSVGVLGLAGFAATRRRR
jgi:MYXO-CTERM domain-containing protein